MNLAEKRTKKFGPTLVRNSLQSKAYIIPSLITSIGVFAGFLSVLSCLEGKLLQASTCIGVAFFLDGLDGRVARKLNATSEFGKQLDSLSDVIAFGVAPAVILYSWAFRPLQIELGVPVAFIFLVCGASRLARFNLPEEDKPVKKGFEGLPIPSAACSLAALVYFSPSPLVSTWQATAVAVYSLLISVLMVSSFNYKSPKYLTPSNVNPVHVLILISATVALAWYNSKVVFLTGFTLYSLSGPAFWLASKLTNLKKS